MKHERPKAGLMNKKGNSIKAKKPGEKEEIKMSTEEKNSGSR